MISQGKINVDTSCTEDGAEAKDCLSMAMLQLQLQPLMKTNQNDIDYDD